MRWLGLLRDQKAVLEGTDTQIKQAVVGRVVVGVRRRHRCRCRRRSRRPSQPRPRRVRGSRAGSNSLATPPPPMILMKAAPRRRFKPHGLGDLVGSVHDPGVLRPLATCRYGRRGSRAARYGPPSRRAHRSARWRTTSRSTRGVPEATPCRSPWQYPADHRQCRGSVVMPFNNMLLFHVVNGRRRLRQHRPSVSDRTLCPREDSASRAGACR